MNCDLHFSRTSRWTVYPNPKNSVSRLSVSIALRLYSVSDYDQLVVASARLKQKNFFLALGGKTAAPSSDQRKRV